jgi:plastocyanin
MGSDNKLQLVGLSHDGTECQTWHHEGGRTWVEGRTIPPLSVKRTYSALVTARGADNVLLVLGLDTEQVPHLVGWQDSQGEWYAGAPLSTDTVWVSVGKYSFSPDDVRATLGQGAAFFLKDRQAPTILGTNYPSPFKEDDKTFIVATGGVCYRSIQGAGEFYTVKDENPPPNEPMQGTITVGDGGGH